MSKHPLYIFVHIPKTAGLTFRYHIRKNLKEEEYLLLAHTLFGYESYPPPDYKKHKSKVFKYMSELSEERKSKLKIIFGHYVPYGVHEYFDRPCRYITFVRHPVKRMISDYNYKVMLYHKSQKRGKEVDIVNQSLLIHNKVPSFFDWWRRYYDTKTRFSTSTMFRFLKDLGYGNYVDNIINKFYFIGLTSKFNEDFLYLSHLLAINRYFLSKNKSKKIFRGGKDTRLADEIYFKNNKDFEILEKSVYQNEKYKLRRNGFHEIVRKKKLRRILTLPFSQFIFAFKDSIKIVLGDRL